MSLFSACHCFESRGGNLFAKDAQLLREKSFKRYGALEDCRIWLVEESTIFEDSHDIANKFTKFAVVLLVHSLFNCLKI